MQFFSVEMEFDLSGEFYHNHAVYGSVLPK